MKVLHILNELRLSGMEMMLINSSLEWKKYNVEITVLSTGEFLGEATGKMTQVGYQVIHIPFNKNKMSSFRIFHRYLKNNRFDIIHIHTESNFLMHALNCSLVGNKNIIRTFHSIFHPTSLKGRIRRHTDRKIAKFLNIKYISVGTSVAENELRTYKTSSEIIFNWYNDRKFFPKPSEVKAEYIKKQGINNETFIITTVGNCSCVKRHNLVLGALALLPPNMDWIYLHAGKEEEGFPERELASQLGILENCRFLGSISNVDEILTISDVFIMSSKVEGLGNSAIEAMAMGIPVILTKVPGLNDLLKNVGGTLGVDSEPKAIKNAIESINKLNVREREALSLKIANQTKDKFALNIGVEKYFRFYNTLSL